MPKEFNGICEQCKQPFHLEKAYYRPSKYCSRKCFGESRKGKPSRVTRPALVEMKCANCEKIVLVSEYRLKAFGVKYCSRDCWKEAVSMKRKAGRYIIPVNQRKHILLTREKRCEECGWNAVPEILELHHRDYNTKNGDPSNLRLLCPNCHQITHFNDGTGRFNKWPRNKEGQLHKSIYGRKRPDGLNFIKPYRKNRDLSIKPENFYPDNHWLHSDFLANKKPSKVKKFTRAAP